MDFEFSSPQRMLLWNLAVSGGQAWIKDLRPEPRIAVRDPLQEADLIRIEHRFRKEVNRQALHMSLTVEGWDYIGQHMDEPLSDGTKNAATEVLEKLFSRLQPWMEEQKIDLADIFQDQPPTGASARAEPESEPARQAAEPQQNESSQLPAPLVDSAILRAVLDHKSKRKSGVEGLDFETLQDQFSLTRAEIDASLKRLSETRQVSLEDVQERSAAPERGRKLFGLGGRRS